MDFEVTRIIEQNKDEIASDFQKFMSKGGSGFNPNQDTDLVDGGTKELWTEYLLFEKGVWNPIECMNFPSVCQPFKKLLAITGIGNGKRSGQVSLLKLEPGTHLVPHFGSVNWRFVAHHGLQVPEKQVRIKVGEEEKWYQQGKTLVLDDSFLHEVHHKGQPGVDPPRITLFVNFFNPNITVITEEEFYDRQWAEQQDRKKARRR
mmetsp:Transcript_124668/g.285584  ORF Transcript_124668/g.285584 Transcript_124668/m.285584 type:complete len:204 (-) Transcript_124668:177-788(-)